MRGCSSGTPPERRWGRRPGWPTTAWMATATWTCCASPLRPPTAASKSPRPGPSPARTASGCHCPTFRSGWFQKTNVDGRLTLPAGCALAAGRAGQKHATVVAPARRLPIDGHVAVFNTLGPNGTVIVGMQTFKMTTAHPAVCDPFLAFKFILHATRGVFAKHHVLAVEARKSLFVLTLDRRLNRRLECTFKRIDHFHEWKGLKAWRQLQTHIGGAALAVRRGRAALLATQPVNHVFHIHFATVAKIAAKLFLKQRAGKRDGARAGAGIGNRQRQLNSQLVQVHAGNQADGIAPPAVIVADQRLAAQHIVKVQAHQRSRAQPFV